MKSFQLKCEGKIIAFELDDSRVFYDQSVQFFPYMRDFFVQMKTFVNRIILFKRYRKKR